MDIKELHKHSKMFYQLSFQNTIWILLDIFNGRRIMVSGPLAEMLYLFWRGRRIIDSRNIKWMKCVNETDVENVL